VSTQILWERLIYKVAEASMKNLPTSFVSDTNEGRVIILIMNENDDVGWIDAAELAQSAGITTEQYSTWLNSMYEMGTVSDRKTH